MFKDFCGKIKDFSRTWYFFKDFSRPMQTRICNTEFLYVQIIIYIYRMVTLETNPPKPFFENDELVVSLDLISP